MFFSFKKHATARPAADAELTSFWDQLRHISPQNDVLTFPFKCCRLELEHKEEVYVRKAYEDLFTLICKNLNPEDPEDRVHRFTISGTPGTGRSLFLFYILWRLANMEPNKTVIIHREKDGGYIYVFQHDRCWGTFNYSDVDEFLDDPTTWYLVDSYSNRPAEVKAIIILMSSPSTQEEMYFRCSATAHPYYLPVWSLEELKMIAPFFSTNLRTVEEQYNLVGGNPVSIFYKIGLKEAIKRIADSISKENFFGFFFEAESNNDDIGYFMVHYLVDSTYSNYSLVFSSKYVTSLILRNLLAPSWLWREGPVSSGERLRRVLLSRKSSPIFSGIKANLFEYAAHRLLSAGGKFIGHSLDDGTALELNIPRRALKLFDDLSECTDPNIYYMARSWGYPCIGSVVLNTGCFQMTITENPAVSEDEMKRIARELNVDQIYFVVPDRIFNKLRRQKPLRMMECRETTQEQTIGGQTVERQKEQEPMPLKRCLDTTTNFGENERQRHRKTQDSKDQQMGFPRQYLICIPLEKDWKNIYHVLNSSSDIFEEEENHQKALMAQQKGVDPVVSENEYSFSDEE